MSLFHYFCVSFVNWLVKDLYLELLIINTPPMFLALSYSRSLFVCILFYFICFSPFQLRYNCNTYSNAYTNPVYSPLRNYSVYTSTIDFHEKKTRVHEAQLYYIRASSRFVFAIHLSLFFILFFFYLVQACYYCNCRNWFLAFDSWALFDLLIPLSTLFVLFSYLDIYIFFELFICVSIIISCSGCFITRT